MPNLPEFLDRISTKISKNAVETLYITVIDLKYAFGQIRLHDDTAKHCVIALVGGEVTDHYRFNKGFYGLADMPVLFQENLDKTLNSLPQSGRTTSSSSPEVRQKSITKN